MHPDIVGLVALTAANGISCGVITNGWFLPRYIDRLAAAGLSRLDISLDSAEFAEHELDRGLQGLERIVEDIARACAYRVPVRASVTISRLIRYDRLPETLRRLGFEEVVFSYPRREPFGSTSLVYGGESRLVDLDRDELLAALAAIGRLRNDRCGARSRGRRSQRRGSIAAPTRRSAIAAGTDRGNIEDASPGTSAKASQGRHRRRKASEPTFRPRRRQRPDCAPKKPDGKPIVTIGVARTVGFLY